ncbi:ABC transporter permease [Nonomuraea angiospora]|uniref:Peptide/nickel transport system permease protein n=1 Tax=Nonomuraea angiospora TaxID=46172 RepID=A0ABR9LQ16_9ACTN|nr:ABC transporter permease [Nonomuraea angiospora]MBE1582739.1 peptide/nickel transport system permease protein [Nonomuraea angiospora]
MSITLEAPSNTGRTATRRLRRLPPLTWAAIAVIAVAVLGALFAPLLAPHSPTGGDILDQSLPMSASHPLGTDAAGNDILSRLLHGARPSLLGPLFVVLLSLLAGVPLALASAWKGGWVDRVIGRGLDLVFCFPSVLVAALIVVVAGRGLTAAVAAIAIAYIPWTARITRTAALRERSKPYIVACYVQGQSALSIALRHLLPNLARMITAQATISFGFALVDLAMLSFVGLGIDPPAPDWGVMVGDTTSIVQGNYNGPLAAGMCIVLLGLAFTFLGNTISDPDKED